MHPLHCGTMTLAACLAPRKDPTKFTLRTRSRSDFLVSKILAKGLSKIPALLYIFLGIKHTLHAMILALALFQFLTSSYVGGAASHAYAWSKHAFLGLTKNVAVELGQFGIRSIALSRYALATPLATKFVAVDDEGLENVMNSLANLKGVTLKAEDVANAVLYFASDESRYVSGHNLLIDGGSVLSIHRSTCSVSKFLIISNLPLIVGHINEWNISNNVSLLQLYYMIVTIFRFSNQTSRDLFYTICIVESWDLEKIEVHYATYRLCQIMHTKIYCF